MDILQNRKGIYQSFDAVGNVTGDERWRIARTLDGGVRIDTDTARISPFIEPRTESFGLELADNLAYRRLQIHALKGQREARADFVAKNTGATFCWRVKETSHTHDYGWSSDCEIGYNSPLFNMVMFWRHPLKAGQSFTVRVAQLDNVTFEPAWRRLSIQCAGDELHDTRFGLLNLTRYKLQFGSAAQTPGESGDTRDTQDTCQVWCDRSGVVFDLFASAGNGYKLVAVNFPS